MQENIINIKEDVIKAIIDKLSTMRGCQDKYTGVLLWTSDAVLNGIANNSNFLQRLKTELDNNDLRCFSKKVEFSPFSHDAATHIMSVDMKIGKISLGLMLLMPRITIITGSMKESVYVLDKTNRTIWNIGRGVKPSPGYKVNSDNYIVIDDEEKDKETLNINEYVSSFHAKILYENDNYYLQAENGGIDRTWLISEGVERVFLSKVKMPLQDGDLINLGSKRHYVQLCFKFS